MIDCAERQRRLIKTLRKGGKLPFLVANMPDIRYLTGFSGSEALVLVTDNGVVFGTDGRYAEEARSGVSAEKIEVYEKRRDFFRRCLKKGGRIYFDRLSLSFAGYEELVRLGFEMVPERPVVRKMRAVKDKGEIDKIARAAVIATTSFLSVCSSVKDGFTEREFAAVLECEMKKRGAESVSFPPIVAAGTNSSKPHASPGERILMENGHVLFDFGCRVDGYCSDETITLGMSGKSGLKKKVFDAVKKALEAGVKMVKPGVRCRDVDRRVREVLDDAGLLRFFPHATGHGVGLEVHEIPSISPRSREVFREGMVVTIEPGVYIPGEGGVRFEDLLLVTDRGGEKLTYFPKTGTFPEIH